jgi:CheY-like chemotaxis protein
VLLFSREGQARIAEGDRMAKMILVVEDNPIDLMLVRDLLKVIGYEAIEATDGEQGVELAKKYIPALILMDIMMPKMDGYAACNAIKMDKTTKEIPVVMLTSLDYDLNRVLAGELGANGYLDKPVTRQKLLDVIHRFCSTP